MDSSVFAYMPLPHTLHALSQVLQPTSAADTIALGLIASAAAGYLLRGVAWDKPDPHRHIYFERPQLQHGLEGAQQQATRNIAQKLQETESRIVVFWGSQSGTAERFANQLAKECHLRFKLGAFAADLSDYDAESIALVPKTKLAIFILSTYGEGDPSDNTSGFWEWINKSEDVSLPKLQYVAFGLGNSNYKYYNKVVDVVVKSLNESGASPLLPVARADDAKRSTEEDFIAWKDDIFAIFRQEFQLEEHPLEYEPVLEVFEDESLEPIDLHHGEPVHAISNARTSATCSPIKALSIKSPRELFSVEDRNCVHIELDLAEHPEIHYKTGDHLAVWPTNPDGEIDYILRALGLVERQDIPISLKSLDPAVKLKVPTPTSAAALFRYYLEICAPLSRDSIIGIAQFAPSPEAKSFLLNLGKDKIIYADFITRTHITLGRLLTLASPTQPWSNLPLAYIVETLPTIKPRYYSISSSSVISPRRIAITAVVSIESLPGAADQNIHGLTTNYLLALSQLPSRLPSPSYTLAGPSAAFASPKLYAHVRKSKFKLPTLSFTPLIMVAAGTGLAPFRAFLSERAKLHAIGNTVGEMVLFFGCRHPDHDFIYREEIEETRRALEGRLRVVSAFSRVEGESRVYVQDRVREEGEQVVRLIDEGASFYICGRASMAREVGRAVSEAFRAVRGWEKDEEVKEWSEALKRRGKWREDVWG